MRFLCTLLAFIVLTLSVQPVCAINNSSDTCCGENSCSENQKDDQDTQKECEGSCNPFQVCGCCAFSVVPVLQQTFISDPEFSFFNSSWATLECPFIEAPILGFWQPPKLS